MCTTTGFEHLESKLANKKHKYINTHIIMQLWLKERNFHDLQKHQKNRIEFRILSKGKLPNLQASNQQPYLLVLYTQGFFCFCSKLSPQFWNCSLPCFLKLSFFCCYLCCLKFFSSFWNTDCQWKHTHTNQLSTCIKPCTLLSTKTKFLGLHLLGH